MMMGLLCAASGLLAVQPRLHAGVRSTRVALPRMLLIADLADEFAAKAGADLADDVGMMVEQARPMVEEATQAIAPAMEQAAQAAGDVGQALAPAMEQAGQALAPAMEQAAQAAGDVGSALQTLGDGGGDILESAGDMVDAVASLAEDLGELVPGEMDAEAIVAAVYANLGIAAPYALGVVGLLFAVALVRALPAAWEAVKPALTAALVLLLTIEGFGFSVKLSETLPFLGDPITLFARLTAITAITGGSIFFYLKASEAAQAAAAKIDAVLPKPPPKPVDERPSPSPFLNPFRSPDENSAIPPPKKSQQAAAPDDDGAGAGGFGGLGDFQNALDEKVKELKERDAQRDATKGK